MISWPDPDENGCIDFEGMTAVGKHNGKWELLLYAGLWGAVFLCPFFNAWEKTIDGAEFQWERIFEAWLSILPFFALFLVHTFLLLPGLFLAGRIKSYLSCVILSLVLFCGYEYSQHPRQRPDAVPVGTMRRPGPPPADPSRDTLRMPKRPLPSARPPEPRPFPVSGPVVIDTVIAVLLLALGLAVRLLFDYFRQQKRISELEKNRIQNELTYLKAQISPHFFMNMLNNIHGMVELDAARAQDMILQLSNLMRYVLYESSVRTIPLSRETAFIADYIALMRERYSPGKVSIEFNRPEGPVTDRMSVPPLIFIVFLENAFKHGISYRAFSFIKVDLAVKDDRIVFRCDNSRHERSVRNPAASACGTCASGWRCFTDRTLRWT